MGCETPCSLADKCQCYRETHYILSATLFCPEDGSNTFPCNDSTHPSHYVASHCPTLILFPPYITVDSSWNVMAHGDAQEGKWRGNWRMEWVASTLHTTSERGVSSITTTDVHTSAASTVKPRLTKIICSGITFISRNTHTDGKDKLLERPDHSCLLLYVSARIH